MHPEFVDENDLDCDEILRRGGANLGDEDFALCKCPACSRLYLIEYEVDTIYLDPLDLQRRLPINISVSEFSCEQCGNIFPQDSAWIGEKAPISMRVTWSDLAASQWCWIAERTRPATESPTK